MNNFEVYANHFLEGVVRYPDCTHLSIFFFASLAALAAAILSARDSTFTGAGSSSSNKSSIFSVHDHVEAATATAAATAAATTTAEAEAEAEAVAAARWYIIIGTRAQWSAVSSEGASCTVYKVLLREVPREVAQEHVITARRIQ